MKFNFLLFSIIVLLSCNRTSKQILQQEEMAENFIPMSGLIQHHTYTKSGLLDTSYQIKNSYRNGEISTTYNLFITRTYDVKNNLINEKTFLISDNEETHLLEEKSIKYDNSNNPILETNRTKTNISEIIKNSYNDKNQKIQEIIIREEIKPYPKNWNLDSMTAHLDDKKISSYDTSITLFEYDLKGNIVKQFYKDHNIENTEITTFSGTQAIMALDVNPKGDTIAVTKYKTQGNAITKIRENEDGSLITRKEIYENGKEMKSIFIDKRRNVKYMDVYRYDKKGNEIEETSYK